VSATPAATPAAIPATARPDAPLLAFDRLAGGYGDTVVLREVGGAVASGEVLGVLGRNGVGKTTLLRLLMGHLPAAAGAISWQGAVLGALPAHARRRLGMSYAPQEGLVFDELTVLENLTLHRRDRGLSVYEELFEAFPRVAQRLRQRAGTLSGGEKKLVSFCRALAEAAPLTLLDEPTEGVQQENLDHMNRFILQRRADGAAFVIVEQNLGFLLATMQRVLVLDHGECVLAGPAQGIPRSTLEAHLAV
jgi:ABC-type branched-subunit amino acid transport system ATPase component